MLNRPRFHGIASTMAGVALILAGCGGDASTILTTESTPIAVLANARTPRP